MTNRVILALSILVTSLFGLMAGFFYAFSVTVMPGLDLAAPAVSIEAMQVVNIAVRNSVFFVTFFLTPVFALGLALLMWFKSYRRAAMLMAIASVVYLAGGLILTMQIHVPMNEALAVVSVDATNAASIWSQYSESWTPWNTVRTVFSSLALIFAGLSVFAQGR